MVDHHQVSDDIAFYQLGLVSNLVNKLRENKDESIRIDQFYRLTPLGIGLSLLLVAAVAWMLWPVTSKPGLVAWGLIYALALTANGFNVYRYFKFSPSQDQRKRWGKVALIFSSISGGLWGGSTGTVLPG